MNITLQLQELDDLIVAHTKPPATAMLRNKLSTLREQMEAYIEAKAQESADAVRLRETNLELVNQKATLEAKLNKAPQGNLEYEAREALMYLFGQQSPCTVDALQSAFSSRVAKNIVQHYCDALLARGLVEIAKAAEAGGNPGFVITAKGRNFVINMDR